MTDNTDKEAYKEVIPSVWKTVNRQRLQAAVWHYANQIIEEEGVALNATATPQFISALADMVYAQAGPSSPF
jgi:CENP-S protein